MVRVFVTGTDTEIGKTRVTQALLAGLRATGRRCVGMKPVASGAVMTPDGLRSEDALALMQQASVQAPYDVINPYLFEPPIAPHIAAQEASIAVRFARIAESYATLCEIAEDVVVEGVGGWRVPLGEDGDVAALAAFLQLPVVLVVGVRLGCINHALLTAESIARSGCVLRGWVANIVEAEMAHAVDNVTTLRAKLSVPCLGVLPYAPQAVAHEYASALSLETLLAN